MVCCSLITSTNYTTTQTSASGRRLTDLPYVHSSMAIVASRVIKSAACRLKTQVQDPTRSHAEIAIESLRTPRTPRTPRAPRAPRTNTRLNFVDHVGSTPESETHSSTFVV